MSHWFWFWSLAAAGFWYVVGASALLAPVRDWLHARGGAATFFVSMIECPGCLGVHLGWIGWILRWNYYLSPWSAAFATCATTMIFGVLVRLYVWTGKKEG